MAWDNHARFEMTIRLWIHKRHPKSGITQVRQFKKKKLHSFFLRPMGQYNMYANPVFNTEVGRLLSHPGAKRGLRTIGSCDRNRWNTIMIYRSIQETLKFNVHWRCGNRKSGCKNGSLQWRHNERDGISNHQPHDCVLNRLFRHRSEKASKLRVTGLCEGNYRPLHSPHKGQETRKMFPFDDVIMLAVQ